MINQKKKSIGTKYYIRGLNKLLYVIISIFILGCNQKDNNSDIQINQIINGKREGLHLNKTNEETYVFRFYKENQINGGEVEVLEINNHPASIAIYANGKENGYGYSFYPSGSLRTIKQWKDGKKTGTGVEYYESGRTHYYKEFNNEGLVIFQKEYDTIGTVIHVIDNR